MRFLLDTNVVSEPIRPKPTKAVIDNLHKYRDEVAIASIVWHELLFGCYRLPSSANQRALEFYLNQVVLPSMPILPYDSQCAEWHAAERARLAGVGKTPPFADGQIAAIAKINDLTLVTLNVADFVRFQGIKVIDWRD